MWSYLRDLVVRGPGLAARHVVVGVLQLIRELLHHQQYDRSVNKIRGSSCQLEPYIVDTFTISF